MSEKRVTHATFVIERSYDATPARVFAAWADPASKARWFSCHESYRMDFRVGGRETTSGGEPGGPVYAYEGRFQDIVPDERIIYSYDMRMDGERISVSLATVELEPEGDGTRLVFTEQGAFLDGYDRSGVHEQGTIVGLERLEEELRREVPALR
jgi:uncharacterized protein YndB with AHSA1/START domain